MSKVKRRRNADETIQENDLVYDGSFGWMRLAWWKERGKDLLGKTVGEVNKPTEHDAFRCDYNDGVRCLVIQEKPFAPDAHAPVGTDLCAEHRHCGCGKHRVGATKDPYASHRLWAEANVAGEKPKPAPAPTAGGHRC
jgi:hypothetical protein